MPTALLSVYHKDGIVDFAQQLLDLGWNLIASGGTARTLKEAGLAVRDVAELVGGKAILGHRVVTLSREVHAGLLAIDSQEDTLELLGLNIPRIDLICVDLYPLKEATEMPGATTESVIEKTDIGGPTMLSSAAKGRRIVICDPTDRQRVIDWLKSGRKDKEAFITMMAAKADFIVAKYRLLSARFHSGGRYDGMMGHMRAVCKYGENAWQTPAAHFTCGTDDQLALDKFDLVAGAPPSFNNLCDMDRLIQTITHIAAAHYVNRGNVPYVALGCKHGNMCGGAIGSDPSTAMLRMISGDPLAIFGGVVMTNFAINEALAEVMLTHKVQGGGRRILDGVAAPAFEKGAVSLLERKKDKCRFLANSALMELSQESIDTAPRFRPVRGGFLRQPNYTFVLDLKDDQLKCYGRELREFSSFAQNDVLLAWAVGVTSNSNTVTLVRAGQLLGNGTGQQDRVACCDLAVSKARRAGHDLRDCIAYSDSFFPFADGPEVLVEAGVGTIFASSGSIKDKEIIDYCASKGVYLWLIPDQRARGFYGH